MFNNLFKKLKMAKNKDKKEEANFNESVNAGLESKEAVKSEEPIKRELTQETLNKAIASFKTDNPDKVWEEVEQEIRWDYLEKAY